MNKNLHDVYVSIVIGLLKSHNLHQAKESIKLNAMSMSVYNCGINGDYCYINIPTVSVIKNNNNIYYTNKRDEISTNRYLRENNGLPYGINIDDMLPAPAPNQYVNM